MKKKKSCIDKKGKAIEMRKILNKLLYLKLNNGRIFIQFFSRSLFLFARPAQFSQNQNYLDGIYVLLSLWPITERNLLGNDDILVQENASFIFSGK